MNDPASKKQTASLPENNAMATVSIPDPFHGEERKPKGLLELTKIKVETTYNICSDEVQDFNDDKNFWILEDEGTYYHWLKKTKPKDQEKLEMLDHKIPIIVHSTQDFKFEAEFDVFSSIETDNIKIRATCKNGGRNPAQYLFNDVSVTMQKNTNTGKKLAVAFHATNNPYANTIQYFENFELFFEYALPNSDLWISLPKVYFRLYITWKSPLWNHFQDTGHPETTMQIKHRPNVTKPNILETLVWLGCLQAKEYRYDNEEDIIDSVFNAFKNLKIVRAREGKYRKRNWKNEGMGYWRGISTNDANPITNPQHSFYYLFYDYATKQFISRGIRLFLQHGEARCDEWTSFFNHILLCQGIKLDVCQIYSSRRYPLFNSDDINQLNALKMIDNYYINHSFLVKGWVINYKESKTNGILEITSSIDLPQSKTNRAQGNKDPLHYFEDHVFSLFEKNGILKWYDPSYGIQATISSPNYIDMLKNYSKSALEGIFYFNENKTQLSSRIPSLTINSNIQNHLFCLISTIDNKPMKEIHDTVIAVIDNEGAIISIYRKNQIIPHPDNQQPISPEMDINFEDIDNILNQLNFDNQKSTFSNINFDNINDFLKSI